jgi:hypothetical protein
MLDVGLCRGSSSGRIHVHAVHTLKRARNSLSSFPRLTTHPFHLPSNHSRLVSERSHPSMHTLCRHLRGLPVVAAMSASGC